MKALKQGTAGRDNDIRLSTITLPLVMRVMVNSGTRHGHEYLSRSSTYLSRNGTPLRKPR